MAPESLWRHLASGDLFESQGDYALAAFQRLQAEKAQHQTKLAVGAYSVDAVTKQELDSNGP